jgi:hypothetical protein
MRRARFPLLLSIAVLALVATGCDEEWCKDKYRLMRIADCDTGSETPDDPTSWPSGPEVTIEPETELAETLDVLVDGTPQTVNGDVSVFDTDPCRLRGDFIGLRKQIFEFAVDFGGSRATATKVTIMADHDDDGTDDVAIEIRQGGFNKIYWSFKEQKEDGRVCTNPEVWEGYTEGEIPKEFKGLQADDMTEATLLKGKHTYLKVLVP